MRRGRPRHDDVLTPREWQVLDLIRQGLTNEQIARGLHISPDTAKFHVSEILTKLGVQSRQDAARWQGEPRRKQPSWLPFWPRYGTAYTLAAGAVIAVLVIAVLLATTAGSGNENLIQQSQAPPAFDGEPPADSQPPRGTPAEVRVVVCHDNDTWVRPTPEQQLEYMTTGYRPVRYGVADALTDRIGAAYAAQFWGFGFSASGQFGMTDMSGLWTADLQGIDFYPGACRPDYNAGYAQVNLWLLNHEAVAAAAGPDGKLTVTVRPTATGFQVVQLQLDGVSNCCTNAPRSIDFADEGGRAFATMDQIRSVPK